MGLRAKILLNFWHFKGIKLLIRFLIFRLNPINHGLYENLLTMGGGHMAPQPENALNLKVGGKT